MATQKMPKEKVDATPSPTSAVKRILAKLKAGSVPLPPEEVEAPPTPTHKKRLAPDWSGVL